jgi:cell division protein FtsZ
MAKRKKSPKKSLKKSPQKRQLTRAKKAVPLGKAKKIKIRVIGIGGGGCSIVSELASTGMRRVSFVVANTDSKALKTVSKKAKAFQFGESVTKGWGTGMNPELGRVAALSDKERIKKLLTGFDLCILVSSLGGGTASGATPIFAKISKDLNNITYGIFTLPFKFEGEKKREIARLALRKLRPKLNIFSVIPNERIFKVINKKTPLTEALSTINKGLAESLEGLIGIIFQPALINIDFADFKTLLINPNSKRQRGKLTYLNTVKLKRQEGTTKELIEKVLNCPLFSYSIHKAKGVLLNIAGEKNLSLAEVTQISKTISNLVDKEAKIIFGISQGRKYKGYLQTTLLATDIPARVFPPKPRKKKTKKKKKKKKAKKLKEDKSSSRTELPQGAKVKKIKKTPPKKVKKGKAKKIKVRVKKEEKESVSKAKASEPKVRKNALQIKKEIEAEEEEMLAKERFWETPAFLRRKNI